MLCPRTCGSRLRCSWVGSASIGAACSREGPGPALTLEGVTAVPLGPTNRCRSHRAPAARCTVRARPVIDGRSLRGPHACRRLPDARALEEASRGQSRARAAGERRPLQPELKCLAVVSGSSAPSTARPTIGCERGFGSRFTSRSSRKLRHQFLVSGRTTRINITIVSDALGGVVDLVAGVV